MGKHVRWRELPFARAFNSADLICADEPTPDSDVSGMTRMTRVSFRFTLGSASLDYIKETLTDTYLVECEPLFGRIDQVASAQPVLCAWQSRSLSTIPSLTSSENTSRMSLLVCRSIILFH